MDLFVFTVKPSATPITPTDSRSVVSPIKAVTQAIEADGGRVDTVYALEGTTKVLAIAELDPESAAKIQLGLKRHWGMQAQVRRLITPERFEQLWSAAATPARASR